MERHALSKIPVPGKASCRPTASLRELTGTRRTAAHPPGKSNVTTIRRKSTSAPMKTRKEVLQEEAQRLLAKEDSWHTDQSVPNNMIDAHNPQHVKKLLMSAKEGSLVVLSFYAPHCRACRAMWNTKKKIAETNPDVTFVKVNTSQESLASMAESLGVSRQPWFMILSGQSGEEIASFTANLETISRLRAEIAAAKECSGPCLAANT